MVSIANTTTGQAKNYYFERDPLFGRNSEWFGKVADMLGLQQGANVNKDDFIAVLEGTDPRTGESLVQGNCFGNHRAGTDVTFSSPKSYSYIAEVLGDGRLINIFKEAIGTSLGYLEDSIIQGRKSVDGGKVRENTGNLIGAIYYHSSSRSVGADAVPDPQLHAHTVLGNITQREDGKIVAIENRSIYENQHLLDAVFKSELAAGARELGYRVITDDRGNFEIAGVPEEVIRNFSKRSAQIDAKAEELRANTLDANISESALREQANLLSRQSKKILDERTLRENWDSQLATLGMTREEALQAAQDAGKQQGERSMSSDDYIRTAAVGLTDTESTFSKSDILRAAGKLSLGEYRISDLEKSFSEQLESKHLVLLAGKGEDLQGVYTTYEMQKIEKQLVSWIKNGEGRAEALMTAETAEKAIDAYILKQREAAPNYELTNSQKNAIRDVVTSDSKYLVVQGDAGAGKSKAVEVINLALSVYAQRDIELTGLAYTGKAAQELERSSGVASQTLSMFLLDSKEGKHGSDNQPAEDLPRKERMYIVDESSMLGSRDAYKLFQVAERDGSKVVLIGDVKQLLSISQGRLFSDIQTKNIIDVSRMDEVIRQKTEHMWELVSEISGKRIDSAFEKMERNGKIHEIENRGELIQTITQEYANRENWQDTLVLSSTNASRNGLNRSIRQALQELGQISSEDIPLTVRAPKNISAIEKHFSQSYAENDYVFTTKAGGGIKAGVISMVIGIDQESHTLTLRDADNNVRLYDVKTHGDKLSAYTEISDFMVSEGQKIIFLKNDTKLGVQNGLTGFVERVDREGNMSIATEDGNQLSFNTKQYNYLDYGNVVSVHKSQGMTADNVVIHVDSQQEKLNTTNSLYTSISRGKFDGMVFTDSISAIREQMKHSAIKKSTLDYGSKLFELDERDKEEKPLSTTQEKSDENEQKMKNILSVDVDGKDNNSFAEGETVPLTEHLADKHPSSLPSSGVIDDKGYELEY